MTLAERLRDLLQTFIDGDASRGMDDIQALATEAEGKVLVEPCVVVDEESGYATFIHNEDAEHVGNGATPADAVANLQALIDSTNGEEAT